VRICHTRFLLGDPAAKKLTLVIVIAECQTLAQTLKTALVEKAEAIEHRAQVEATPTNSTLQRVVKVSPVWQLDSQSTLLMSLGYRIASLNH
jgi:hypothetical protein